MMRRQASRLIVLDPSGLVLLFRYADSHGRALWATPGGGLEPGESFEQAAAREAREELGVSEARFVFAWEEENAFVNHDGVAIVQQERFFVLRLTNPQSLPADVSAAHRQEGILEWRWCTATQLESAKETICPTDLALRLRSLKS